MKLIVPLFFIILLAASIHAQKPLSVEDMLHIKRVHHVLISPDGTHVLYLSSGNIWLASANSPYRHRKIDTGTSVQWRPDSQAIVYQKDSPNTLYQYTLKDSLPAQVLLKETSPIHQFRWSPDGQKMAYLKNQTLRIHLFQSGKAMTLPTENSMQVTEMNWSDNSQKIVFVSQENGYIFTINSQSVMPLLSTRNPAFFQVRQPRWASENTIYYLTLDAKKEDWLSAKVVAVVNLNTHQARLLNDTADKDIDTVYGYCRRDNGVYFLSEQGFGYNLCRLNLNTGKTVSVTSGSTLWEEFSFSKNFNKAAFTLENTDTAPELYVSSFPQLAPQKISSFNESLAHRKLGKSELIHWKSPDGQVIEGMLISPISVDPAKKYPLIVWLHGGPASCFSSRYANGTWHYPTQVLAAEGFYIFMPNPRGSTGYGNAFKQALIKKWGEIDYEDVMSGIDAVIQEKKTLNPDRIGIAGWSYGGYLGNVLLAKAGTRFKAASIGAGLSDLVALYATIDIPDWLEAYFGHTPYQNPTPFIEHSPLYRLAHQTLKTPVLIQHGQADKRVPLNQARMLYRVLKAQGTPVTLIEYPDEPHVLKKDASKRDSMRENIQFFKKFLQK